MISRFGFWAAAGAAAASIAYAVPQLLQVAGLLHDPWDRILIFAPSLALAPAFVLTMAAVVDLATPDNRVFARGALALAIMYAVLVSIVYVTQLGVVIPADIAKNGAATAIFGCCGHGQFATGLDLLGYTLMSLSTLVAAPVFRGQPAVRWWLIANGILAPFLFAQIAWPALIYVGAAWLVTFPVAMILVARSLAADPVTAALELRTAGLAARLTLDRMR